MPSMMALRAAADLELAARASINAKKARLERRDLLPFRRVATEAPAIMLGHFLVRSIDPDNVASVSPPIVARLRTLGFDGVCITDCLTMAGAGDASEAAVRALAAGGDAVIGRRPLEAAGAVATAIVRAVETHLLPMQRLTEAHDRVIGLRKDAREPIAVDAFPPH